MVYTKGEYSESINDAIFPTLYGHKRSEKRVLYYAAILSYGLCVEHIVHTRLSHSNRSDKVMCFVCHFLMALQTKVSQGEKATLYFCTMDFFCFLSVL